MIRILAAAALALCGLSFAPVASAQTEPTLYHAFQSTQGCIYYLAQTQGNPPPEPGERTWSGSPCTPGQPINGTGALMWTQDGDIRGGFSGRMVNGNWDGEIINHIELLYDGAWHGDDMDGMAIQFVRGCVASQVPDDCQPAPANAAANSDGGYLPPLQQQQQTAQQQTNPPPPGPTETRRVHNPNNDGSQCVTTRAIPNNAQGAIEFYNGCPWTVWVLWPGGMEDLSRGGTYPTFQTEQFRYYACKKDDSLGAGPYQTPEMAARGEVICQGL